MKNTDYFRGKKVVVLGLARSGAALAGLLFSLGAQVYISDSQDNEMTRRHRDKIKAKGLKVELGRHSLDFIKEKDLVIVSPGVAYNAQPLLWARQLHIPVIGEIEAGWLLCPGTVIAVTGSNGKTTVTTLIGKILEAAGKKVFICGNIGSPFCAEVEKMKEGDFVSLEVSSFQLESIDKFKPKIAVILNFSQNHLDRHRDLDEYLAAKKRIFMNQDAGDYLVLNYEDRKIRGLAKESPAQAVFFKEENGINANQAAALAVASICAIAKDTCLSVFRQFGGVEHRLEFVTQINGVDFINDSKSTNVEATAWALETLKRPVVLIAGGRDKNLDYSIISGLLRKKAKAVILIGEAKDKIRQAFREFPFLEEALDIEEAVVLASKIAKTGDCVLLSPMCASFDMFFDYEERGRVFKKAVHKLMTNDKILPRI